MSSDPESNGRRGRRGGQPVVSPEAFFESFRERLPEVLDVRTWGPGRDPDEEYRRIEEEVRVAVEHETRDQQVIRRQIHPLLAASPTAPPGAGVYSVKPWEVMAVQRGLLFNGAVEACDGTRQVHDTLALTVHRLAVSLVSYLGERGSWRQTLFRRDVRQSHPDPQEAVLELLERRSRRAGLHAEAHDALSDLARRGLMSFAERAVLARCAGAPWRMGHGSPAPLEMLVGTFADLTVESIKVVRELVRHRRFVFVASEPDDRALLTIGQGLFPLEYAVVGTLREWVDAALDDWSPGYTPVVGLAWAGVEIPAREWVRRFRDEVAPRVVYGVYRATYLAPPQVFFAHEETAGTAARIALADSVLLEQRGFPMLIDLADRLCRSVYGGGTLQEMAETAYARAGAPFRYASERATRPG
jgi:hypothetical protein